MWIILLSSLLLCMSEAGFTSPGNENALEDLQYTKGKKDLDAKGKTNPSFSKYVPIDTNFYEYHTPDQFFIGIIIDPCRNRDPGCCQDTFGVPTYEVEGSALKSPIGAPQILNEQGKTLLIEVSRLADRFSVWDPECFATSDGIPFRVNTVKHDNGSTSEEMDFNDPLCVGRLQALVPLDDGIMPSCWDRNATVRAAAPCFAADGLKRQNCLSVAYTQTALIVQCGQEYTLDNHCGTFIELHKPGDETILSQTRLLAEYTSGYRTTTIPFYYKGDRSKSVCRGHYELWWVIRTKSNFIVQYKKKFYIETPECSFDVVTNQYSEFYNLS